ncbi:ATPase [Litorivicinus lipolyticus]|uniref:ATPase n=1 Tax=Litorivicinus lipolyticus TaxID=418701 RepID=A0A5Q2QED2_9GAMM|nr:elongation factor P hydroxylase [Litorivicinus lipolyticus]QGG80386.1 ATPase [Litorivicinus lipolyticus]
MLTGADIEAVFNACFHDYATTLAGGFDEPFYRAGPPAQIQYRADFLRSALHETAHWCVAGSYRRTQDDYGYWYEADGRDADQQREFERVEVVPQAIESLFCDALAIEFTPSIDNLTAPPATITNFQTAIAEAAKRIALRDDRLTRAHRFIAALKGL